MDPEFDSLLALPYAVPDLANYPVFGPDWPGLLAPGMEFIMRTPLFACGLTGLLIAGLSACKSSPDDNDSPPDTDAVVDSSSPSPCEGMEGEGYGEGDISMDWTLQTVDGESVSLYDYCGQVIFIEDTTAW